MHAHICRAWIPITTCDNTTVIDHQRLALLATLLLLYSVEKIRTLLDKKSVLRRGSCGFRYEVHPDYAAIPEIAKSHPVERKGNKNYFNSSVGLSAEEGE